MFLNPDLDQAYFDADNTVINVRKSEYEAFLYCFKEMFGIELSLAEVSKITEYKIVKSLPILLNKYSITPAQPLEELVKTFLDIRREFIVRPENLCLIKPADGVLELLKNLKYMRVKTAIVTNSKTKKITKMLESVGLLEYFDTIKGNLDDDTFQPKPSPQGLILAQEELAQRSFSRREFMESKSLFFGDNLRDGTAVRTLNKLRQSEGYKHNMKFVGIDLRDTGRTNTEEAISRLQSDYYIGNFTHIQV